MLVHLGATVGIHWLYFTFFNNTVNTLKLTTQTETRALTITHIDLYSPTHRCSHRTCDHGRMLKLAWVCPFCREQSRADENKKLYTLSQLALAPHLSSSQSLRELAMGGTVYLMSPNKWTIMILLLTQNMNIASYYLTPPTPSFAEEATPLSVSFIS